MTDHDPAPPTQAGEAETQTLDEIARDMAAERAEACPCGDRCWRVGGEAACGYALDDSWRAAMRRRENATPGSEDETMEAAWIEYARAHPERENSAVLHWRAGYRAAHPSLDREALPREHWKIQVCPSCGEHTIASGYTYCEHSPGDVHKRVEVVVVPRSATPLDREPVLDDAALLAAANAVGEAEGSGLLDIEHATRIAVETYVAQRPDLMGALDAPFTTSDGSDDPIRASAQKAMHAWLAVADLRPLDRGEPT